MTSPMIERLEAMLADGNDSTALRFGLGNAYLDTDPATAADHYRAAVDQDPSYSAAWKMLGKAEAAAGRPEAAAAAYRSGIEAAEARGDVQAAKEMGVFLKRLQR